LIVYGGGGACCGYDARSWRWGYRYYYGRRRRRTHHEMMLLLCGSVISHGLKRPKQTPIAYRDKKPFYRAKTDGKGYPPKYSTAKIMSTVFT
jgi:hypothetical protein